MILIIIIALVVFAGLHLIISKNSKVSSTPKISKNVISDTINVADDATKLIDRMNACNEKNCPTSSTQICDEPHQTDEYYAYDRDNDCGIPEGGGFIACQTKKMYKLSLLRNNSLPVCKQVKDLPSGAGQNCGSNCKPPYRCISGKCCDNKMVVNDRSVGRPICSTGEIGDLCNSNDTCKSKNCIDSSSYIAGIYQKTCDIGLKSIENNAVCKEDDKCKSGACGYGEMNGVNQICCESGGTTSLLGSDYCTNFKNNKQCRTDSMCASKACGIKDLKGNSICCESGKTTDYLLQDFCAGRKKGEKCYTDAMCASGNCKGNNSGLSQGVCT